MQAKNKKAIRKLEREIADDEAEIEKSEASKQASDDDDDDDDDIAFEVKKKHIKQVLNFPHLQNCWFTIYLRKQEVLLEDLVRDPVPSCIIMLSCNHAF